MARIGVDLDGVCYDFSASVYLAMEHQNHPKKPSHKPESETWSFYEDWGLDVKEFIDIVNQGVDDGIIFCGPCRPGTKEAFRLLREAGHTLHIVTDRRSGTGDNAKENTYAWLNEHDLPYDTLTFSADKTVVKTDYFIEDKLENYDALEAAGVRAYLVDRPWNHDDSKERRRVDGILHFAQTVIERERLKNTPFVKTINNTYSTVPASAGTYNISFPTITEFGLFPTSEKEEVRTTSSTGGQKGTKLARYDLIPADALEALAEHFGRGAMKYAARNWEKGYEWSKNFAALQRHIWAFWSGEDIDEETGSLHLVAAMWHAAALTHYYMNPEKYEGFDDRP